MVGDVAEFIKISGFILQLFSAVFFKVVVFMEILVIIEAARLHDHVFGVFLGALYAGCKLEQFQILRQIVNLERILRLCHSHCGSQFRALLVVHRHHYFAEAVQRCQALKLDVHSLRDCLRQFALGEVQIDLVQMACSGSFHCPVELPTGSR